jgi:hypothetical protein
MIWGSQDEEYEDVTPCSLVGIRRRFVGNFCLHLPYFYSPLFLSTCPIVFFDNGLSLLQLYIPKNIFYLFSSWTHFFFPGLFPGWFCLASSWSQPPIGSLSGPGRFSLSVYFTLNFAAWLTFLLRKRKQKFCPRRRLIYTILPCVIEYPAYKLREDKIRGMLICPSASIHWRVKHIHYISVISRVSY